MEDLHVFRRRFRRTGWTGLILFLVFIVPVAISALKSCYANKLLVLGDIAANCYQSFGWIKALWPSSFFPVFSVSDGFGFGDGVAIAYALGLTIGVFLLSDWWRMLRRMERLQREANDENLRQGF